MIPNLFILGAGKCGTTSLYHLLGRHPEIHVSIPKEPSFFCRQFQVVKNPIDYFRLFDSPRRYRVDASHVYFSNPETAPVLRAIFPEAKFLVILRHPKARAHSLYQHMRRFGHRDGQPLEQIDTFHGALLSEEQRFRSESFLADCRHYFWNFMYMRSSCYDQQLERYFALYPRDRFLIISLAELRLQSGQTVGAIADFLGLDFAGVSQGVPFDNVAPAYAPYDAASDALMDGYFTDLTVRVDRLVGRPLDWAL